MDRRRFLQQSLGTAAGIGLGGLGGCLDHIPAVTPAPYERPEGRAGMNLVLIIADDLTTRALGSYGHTEAHTPHLDRLAEQGLRFDRAYCAAPMGHPSRASFFTGLRPEHSGVTTRLDSMNARVPAAAAGLAAALRPRGAYQANVGHLLHGPEAHRHYHPFDQLEACRTPVGYIGKSLVREAPECPERRFRFSADPALEAELTRRAQTWARRRAELSREDPAAWYAAAEPYEALRAELLGDSGQPAACDPDARRTDLAIQVIERAAARDRQFLLTLALDSPHVPLVAPAEFLADYDPEHLTLPVRTAGSGRNVPAAAHRFGVRPELFSGRFDADFPQLRDSLERQHRALAAYYAAVTCLDAQIGRLLAALEATELVERTVVVFLSDHGFHLGEHGLWSKYTQYEEVTRVPLILRVPGASAQGRSCDAIVELVDLLPTCCELWGLTPPEICQGDSLLPLLDDSDRPWKRAAFNHFDMRAVCGRDLRGRTVRTKRYRYTEWGPLGASGLELYDLFEDPREEQNQAYNGKYKPIRARLAEGLSRGWQVARPGPRPPT